MKDFRVVQAQTILQVYSATFIAGFVPRSILVHGPRMLRATGASYNGVEVLEFVISSPTSLIIRIPASQVDAPFRELIVYAATPLAEEKAQLSFALGRSKVVSGLDRLIQMFMIILFTSPGSSIFNKKSGGGLRKTIGIVSTQGGSVAADINMALERATSEILKVQARRTVPLDERLLSATLESLSFDTRAGNAYARVSIRNSLGESAQIQVR